MKAFMLSRTVLCILAFALGAAPAVFADEPPPELLAKEEAALAKVASELVRLARFCEQNKAFGEARAVLDRGLAACPESPEIRDALTKLESRADDPKPTFAKLLAEKRSDAFLRCAKALGPVALAFQSSGFPDRFDRLVALVKRHFTSDEGLAAFGLQWFEPYCQWVPKAAVSKLSKGWDLSGGEWLDPAAVAKGNAAHSTWTDPWVVTDGIHELRTTLPLRTALGVLGHVTAFREFFLSRISGAWDLRPPNGKLPIILTDTQSDFVARHKEASGGVKQARTGGLIATSLYLWTSRPLNPCLVTYEPLLPKRGGGTISVRIAQEEMLCQLRHEVAHQIAYEYSRHAYPDGQYNKHCYWAIEGLAQFMYSHRQTKEGFTPSLAKLSRNGDRLVESDFAYTQRMLGSLPTLEKFIEKTDEGLREPEDYLVLDTAAWFLLDGQGGKYRKRFLAVLETAHQVREDADTYRKCFEGVDRDAMQKEWEQFVRWIALLD
jgi:hypothetical protein